MSQELFEVRKGPGRPPGSYTTLEHREKLRAIHRALADNDPALRARRDKLKSLIEQGYTNQAAAIALGSTKSAVGKMLWRMQQRGIVVNRPVPVLKIKTIKEPRPPRSKMRTAPQPRKHIEHPPMTPVTLQERAGCCFPVNDGGPYLFCDNPKHDRSSYCEFHGNLMVRQE